MKLQTHTNETEEIKIGNGNNRNVRKSTTKRHRGI